MKRTGLAKAYFLAKADEVRDMINRGYPLTMVYDLLHPALSYPQFTRYVRTYLGIVVRSQSKGKIELPPGLTFPSPQKPIEKQGEKEPHFSPGSSLSDNSKTIGKEEESPQKQEVKPFESFEKFDYNPVPPKKEDVW